MKDALDVHRALLARELPHEIIRLPRLVLSADEIPAMLDLPSEQCVAVRIYHADDQLVAVLVRAGEQPHPGTLLNALNARSLRSASHEVVNRITDFAAGLVSPVLLPDDMPVLADACLGHHDVVYAATGDAGTALGIASRALLTTSRARATELCEPPVPTFDVLDEEFTIDVAPLLSRQSWR